MTGTITTALGTVAALMWTDAIRTLFSFGGIFETKSRLAPWLIAVAATLLAIWGSRALAALNAKVSTLKKPADTLSPALMALLAGRERALPEGDFGKAR